MSLSEFIIKNMDAILSEWDKFAGTIPRRGQRLSQEELRSGAKGILIAIAQDMTLAQTGEQQQTKSQGHRIRAQSVDAESAAQLHASRRLNQGFDLNNVVSEYRALRASVIRLWTRQMGYADRSTLDELTRFNEAIDEELVDAIARFMARVDHAKDLLLAVLGHDLRSPLGAILQSAQFLLKADHLESQHTKAASRILNSGTRMKAMISDLLDFARTRLGDQLPISPAPMDMGDACRQIINEVSAFYPDCTLHFESTGNLFGVWDAARIGQMLSNLVGNAVEHGSTEAPVLIVAAGNGDEVRVSIHNEGTPIARNDSHRIFEPLARGSPSQLLAPGAHVSIGLGLYIAREIATAHRGTVELIGSDDQGTTFVATLPRQPAG